MPNSRTRAAAMYTVCRCTSAVDRDRLCRCLDPAPRGSKCAACKAGRHVNETGARVTPGNVAL